jgi:Domain of unknown function (DUF4160)
MAAFALVGGTIAMPVVFRETGYTFFFYSDEGDPREPLHIHVRGKGCTAKIWIKPEIAVQDSTGFNPRDLRKIVGMVENRAKLIESIWHEHFSD